MTEKQHEALGLPLSERVDYLIIVASMAGADVELKQQETDKLKALCEQLGLPDEELKKVLTAAQSATASIHRHLEGLKASPLRFSLLSDCVSLAYADGKYENSEKAEIRSLAAQLDVSEEQLSAIEELVATCHQAAKGGPVSEKHGEEIATKLAQVGVPVGVMAAVSVVGLEMTGAATGLAALGIGLGAATGFGAVFGLGVGTYMGVRWLQKRIAHGASAAP
jgi:uncharacterized tellurite resistance protein B-like protein